MGSNKLYINGPYAKYNSDNQTIAIAFDIEYIQIVTHRIGRSKKPTDFTKICPVCLFCNKIPVV